MVASGGEVKKAAIGDQGTSLDLQLLDQSCVSKKILEIWPKKNLE